MPSVLDSRDLNVKSTNFSISRNTPLLILIVVGSVVLAATLIGSLAWLCCSFGDRNGKQRSRAGVARRRNSFSPTRPGSVYSFGDGGSIAGLSLREKSDVTGNRSELNGGSRLSGGGGRNTVPLSPVSPMPALKADVFVMGHGTTDVPLVLASLTRPAPVADTPVRRGRGWQLCDAQATGATVDKQSQPEAMAVAANMHDVEAGYLPPARRPSFIDRLLAHRSISQHNATKMSTGMTMPETPRHLLGHTAGSGAVGGSYSQERSFTAPMMFNGFTAPPPTPGTGVAGSALLSAIGGAFRRVSQQHQQPFVRRKHLPSPRQMPIESDYEGTIGGRDAELPMACRAGERRPLCGDSITNSPRSITFAADQDPLAAHLSPRPFTRSPLGMSRARLASTGLSPLSMQGTPHTPGIAGVGTAWLRRMSDTALPVPHAIPATERQGQQRRQTDVWLSVAEQRGPKGRLSDWVLESRFAAAPPPDEASRRGSMISFVMSERSLPSVSRQNSVVGWPISGSIRAATSSRRTKRSSNASAENDDEQLPSFAPLTSLTSWLDREQPAQPSEQTTNDKNPSLHADGHRTMAASEEEAKQSIMAEYMTDILASPALAKGSDGGADRRSLVTDYEQARGTLWDDIGPSSTRPLSYRTEPSSSSTKVASRTLAKLAQRQAGQAMMFGIDEAMTPVETAEAVTGDDDEDALRNAEEEAEDRRKEKKMRKRMRRARRAARQAAKEAAMLEANRLIAALPAVRAAVQEHTDTTTSDSSKAQEQTARHVVLDSADASSTVVGGSYCDLAGEEKAAAAATHPAASVAELLLHTPELTPNYKAPVLADRRTNASRAGNSIRAHRVGNRQTGHRHAALTTAPVKSLPRISAQHRMLSSPESPLTSASEKASVPPSERRASMPAMRSFLVESRRGSEQSSLESHRSSRHQSADLRMRQSTDRQTEVKRITSMPVAERGSARPVPRQLPVPPSFAGVDVPLSAFEQLPRAAVVIV